VEEQMDYSREISREKPVIEEIPEPLKVSALPPIEPNRQSGILLHTVEGTASVDHVAETSAPTPARNDRDMKPESDCHMQEDGMDADIEPVKLHAANSDTVAAFDQCRESEGQDAQEVNEMSSSEDETMDEEDDEPGFYAANGVSNESEPLSDGALHDSLSDEEDEPVSINSSGYSYHMHEKVDQLPVPSAIKQYLLFYRT